MDKSDSHILLTLLKPRPSRSSPFLDHLMDRVAHEIAKERFLQEYLDYLKGRDPK